MADLPAYQFPARITSGLMFGLSLPRLLAVGTTGAVFVVMMAVQTGRAFAVGLALMVGLLAAGFVRVGGRAPVEWLPVWAAHGWSMATRANEFYTAPDLADPLPEGMLDLPGELFGLELHSLDVPATATVANPTSTGYGVLRDTFRRRLIAIAELSGDDFLFLDPDDQQGRVSGWGALLDHIGQSLPELCRLQVVHTVGPASIEVLARWHRDHGRRAGTTSTASYRQVLDAAGQAAQEHRTLLAVALDVRAARRAIRQAGGGLDGAAQVLMDRAAILEEAAVGCGLQVHGWLPARAVAQLLRVGFDPAARLGLADRPEDVTAGGGVDPAACGPWGMVDGWAAVRHDTGWSTTLQVVRPPARPVTGDFLQHLLIGVPAERRMSLLYVPTPMAVAERRAQSQQISRQAEVAGRARLGFDTSARLTREHHDAARREEELAAGRTVYRLVWLLTVTALAPSELEAAVGQVEAAARRCDLELRRLSGLQRQAAGFTLPLCRGAR